MIESEDGTVTGSIDVERLGEIDPKTDEAKAQLEALQAEAKAAEQAAADAEKAEEKAPAAESKPDDKAPAKKAAASPSHSSTDKS